MQKIQNSQIQKNYTNLFMRNKKKYIKFNQSINFALKKALKKDKKLICFGLGINDPKNIFGTTQDLKKMFGKKRIFDVPNSENALTGVSIGAAINKVPSVVSHQRFDFFLLAMDQLVNSAAKWHYMFGGKMKVPITIRLIIGRGWGQGPTHSQSLHAWLSHIPGLKVVCPSNSYDAAGLLYSSIFDPNPVIFLEHRWLHESLGKKNLLNKKTNISKAKIVKKGKNVTIVSMSFLTVEAQKAAEYLYKYKIDAEVVDLISLHPIDWKTIISSIKKTGKLLVLDMGAKTGSLAGEIIAKISSENHKLLKTPPARINMPDIPVPTSYGLTKKFYPNPELIVNTVLSMFNLKKIRKYEIKKNDLHHDVPNKFFKGPF